MQSLCSLLALPSQSTDAEEASCKLPPSLVKIGPTVSFAQTPGDAALSDNVANEVLSFTVFTNVWWLTA
jgi:hypothetical protein